MPRNTYRPATKNQKSDEIYREQDRFDAAMVGGPPASEIPENSVAWLYNAVAYPKWLQGRFGSRIYAEECRVTYPETLSWPIGFPGERERNNLNGSKDGYVVTSSNANFTEGDVANYFVWNDGYNDLIMEYISATQVRVRDSQEQSASNSCFIRGKHNGWHFHKGLKKVVVQLGGEFYVSNNLTLSSWSRVLPVSASQAFNVISQFDDFDDTSIIAFNSNGIFKIVLDVAEAYCYRVNTNGPFQYVTGVLPNDTLPIGYRYIYTATRLRGTDPIRSRVGSFIEQESCPNLVDDDQKDYGEVWTANLRGDGTKTHGVLTSGTIQNASLDAVNVWAVVDDGTFQISINSRFFNIWVDFTDVTTMSEVAERIQIAIRQYWPDATCVFSANTFIITSGLVDGSTVDSVGTALGGGGTDIVAVGYANFVGATIETVTYAEPYTIQDLQVPRQQNTNAPEWHFTHYSIYKTLNIGPAGTDPVTGQANDPERYIWAADLRVAGAFLATKSLSGLVTAIVGEFEEGDVNSVLEWEDGDRDTIIAYVDSLNVIVDTAAYPEEAKFQACAIGNGRVFRTSQSGYFVTRTQGDVFTEADERKMIYWADGSYSYIVDYISENRVRVHDSVTRQSQGITLDPEMRNWNELVDDDLLIARTKSYTIRNRAWEPLPLTNTGKVVPGWIFCAVREEQRIYYAQHAPGTKYLAGGHNPLQETTDCKDAIKRIEEFPNRVVIYCSSSVYGGPTNTSIELKVEGTGEFVNVFAGLQLLEEDLGVPDYGSVKPVSLGKQVCRTSQLDVRIFDGFKFGPNLAETADGMELVMDELRSWANSTAAGYKDGVLYLWGLV